ncbi:MAG TPA: NFACT RNA binding domain-containing protein [Ktedonobacteraceae bacterium]|nr:NFACT RNA binding domain-containing protein [Ktedonobacteraceae bacterium]
MHVDAITLAAVSDELRLLLTGARIDTIIQPTEYALALQCYAPGGQGQGGQNRWLYLSAHPQLARVHLTSLKPAKIASEPPPFVMLLRKHLEGTRIESIVQPRWERVVEIIAGYRSSPDSDERVRFRLIIEVMGRVSNIIFCNEEGLILGSLKRIGAEINRYRVIAAGVPYVPPPPQQRTVAGQSLPRLEPTGVSAAQLSLCATEEEAPESEPLQKKIRKRTPEQPKLWQLLTKHLLGFSPLLAREAVYRTTQDTETPLEKADEAIWKALAQNVQTLAALYDTHSWHPQMIERQTGHGETMFQPLAFAPYILEQYAQVPSVRVRQSSSINVILDEFYARAEWRDAMESLRTPLRKVLQTQLDRCHRKAELLQQETAKGEEADSYRLSADLLLAHQHEVQQGQSSVTVENFFETDGKQAGPLVTIPLDPRFDAVGNANRLFNKYHKLRRALTLLPAQIEQNAVELATIEQLLADLMLAETPAEVVLVKAEVQAAGYMRGKSVKEDKKAQKAAKKGKGGKQGKGKPTLPGGGVPLHVQSRDGFTILIGKNSRQNEEVTFHQATANDIWLHARGVPGSHVIIKAAGRDVPRSTIEQAASLAAYYSQARGSTSVSVDYTLQKHVRHMKGGGPGMVVYERERTVYAEPKDILQPVKM